MFKVKPRKLHIISFYKGLSRKQAQTSLPLQDPLPALESFYPLPPMAAVARLFRSSSSSCAAAFSTRRYLSTAAAATELKSQSCIPRIDPKGRNFQWVFLGCPGVGKGTYASRLSALLGVPHIATGDLVREELSSSGPLSKQVCDILTVIF